MAISQTERELCRTTPSYRGINNNPNKDTKNLNLNLRPFSGKSLFINNHLYAKKTISDNEKKPLISQKKKVGIEDVSYDMMSVISSYLDISDMTKLSMTSTSFRIICNPLLNIIMGEINKYLCWKPLEFINVSKMRRSIREESIEHFTNRISYEDIELKRESYLFDFEDKLFENTNASSSRGIPHPLIYTEICTVNAPRVNEGNERNLSPTNYFCNNDNETLKELFLNCGFVGMGGLTENNNGTLNLCAKKRISFICPSTFSIDTHMKRGGVYMEYDIKFNTPRGKLLFALIDESLVEDVFNSESPFEELVKLGETNRSHFSPPFLHMAMDGVSHIGNSDTLGLRNYMNNEYQDFGSSSVLEKGNPTECILTIDPSTLEISHSNKTFGAVGSYVVNTELKMNERRGRRGINVISTSPINDIFMHFSDNEFSDNELELESPELELESIMEHINPSTQNYEFSRNDENTSMNIHGSFPSNFDNNQSLIQSLKGFCVPSWTSEMYPNSAHSMRVREDIFCYACQTASEDLRAYEGSDDEFSDHTRRSNTWGNSPRMRFGSFSGSEEGYSPSCCYSDSSDLPLPLVNRIKLGVYVNDGLLSFYRIDEESCISTGYVYSIGESRHNSIDMGTVQTVKYPSVNDEIHDFIGDLNGVKIDKKKGKRMVPCLLFRNVSCEHHVSVKTSRIDRYPPMNPHVNSQAIASLI